MSETKVEVLPKVEVFDLATIEDMTPAAMFVAGALEPIITAITAEIDAFIPDTTTKKGRDAILSLAHKVGKVAVRVENGKKQLTAEWRKQTADVNAEGKSLDEKLRTLQERAKAPMIAWKIEDDKRIAAEKIQAEKDLAHMEALHEYAAWQKSEETRTEQERVAEEQRIAQEKIDEQQAELKRQQEKIDADKQKLIDDEADLVRVAEEAEKNRLSLIRAEEERVENERLQKIADDEQVETDRLAEEQRVKDEEKRIEAARLQAIEDEKKRVAAEKEQERLKQVKRDEDKRIRNRVHNKIIAAIQKHACDHEITAESVVEAIAAGKIPNVTITY